MSDMHGLTGRGPADDPFAPEVVEMSVAQSLRPDAPATSTAQLVRTLADAYTLPQVAGATLARSRTTLARRAKTLTSGRHPAGGRQVTFSRTSPAPSMSSSRLPQSPQPPRRRHSPFETFLRTAAAVLVVALLGAGFYALLRSVQGRGTRPHPTPTATHPPTSATATATSTPIPPQPPAPAGVYVTAPGTLFRIDPSTGAVEHRYPIAPSGQAVVGIPVVANGVVYFTYLISGTPPESGVVALSATTGTQLWRTQTAGGLSELLLAGGTLYGGTRGTGTGTDTFYALRASDGSVLWTFNSYTLRANTVVTGGVVYLAEQPQNTSIQHIHALRASDGSQLWDAPLPQDCSYAVEEAVDAGMVFVGCSAPGDHGQGGNGSVYGLRASDGALVWHTTTNGEPAGGLAAGAGLLYYSVGGKNAAGANAFGLFALDETSGKVRWQVPNGGGSNVFEGTTLYSGLGSDLALAAFSASSGALLWTYPESNQRPELGSPVIASGVVYQILNEQVVAISAANGSVLWRSPTLGNLQQAPSGLCVVTGG
jgi:outer membrane protein assembly factor BamB